MTRPPNEPIDHQVERAAAEERYRDNAANLFRAVLKGDVATHAQTTGGVRKKPKKRTQTHQRRRAR